VCHVEDVARAHVAAAFAPALEHDVYVCAGQNVSYRDLFLAMRSMLHSHPSARVPIGGCCGMCSTIPRWALVVYGWGCELHSDWWSGDEPEINPGMARYMSCCAYYTSGRACAELGYPDQSQRWLQAIADSYQWYIRRGRF